jgi:hypothetical protein
MLVVVMGVLSKMVSSKMVVVGVVRLDVTYILEDLPFFYIMYYNLKNCVSF